MMKSKLRHAAGPEHNQRKTQSSAKIRAAEDKDKDKDKEEDEVNTSAFHRPRERVLLNSAQPPFPIAHRTHGSLEVPQAASRRRGVSLQLLLPRLHPRLLQKAAGAAAAAAVTVEVGAKDLESPARVLAAALSLELGSMRSGNCSCKRQRDTTPWQQLRPTSRPRET